MEYDNDRPVKPVYKPEVFYWIAVLLLYPLINFVSFFYGEITLLPVLFLTSLILLPFYIVYAKVIVQFLAVGRRRLWFGLATLFFALAVLGLLSIIYSFIHLDENPNERLQSLQAYFTFSSSTVVREILWIIVNITFAMSITFLKNNFDEQVLIASLEKENVNFKLKYLRSRLNPHFLFNTLNSIYSLSLQKSDKTPEVVIKLADLMRYMVYDCDEEKITLDKEIEFIKNYVDIERIRYNADIRFSVEGETEGIMIEPLLFISFIENGFKHAFNNAYTDAFVYITIKVSAGKIVLNVINNTNTDLETQAKKMPGTGIKNSKSLLELVYKDAYALDIIQTDTEEKRKTNLRINNAKKRLEALYPDSHTLDVILSKNAYTVSLIIKTAALDKMYHS